MARILVTGSSDGLGLNLGRHLADAGHAVVLHARSEQRADDARAALPAAEAVLVGDLSTLEAMHDVARQADASGRFDAVVHNVGLGHRTPDRVETVDGLSRLWAVNVLAPYVLTALTTRPGRLVYLSSDMHRAGDPDLSDVQFRQRRWDSTQAYCDSKLHDVMLAFAVARHWPEVPANAVSPGWVATRMGGAGASDDLEQGHLTQAWLAVGDDPGAVATGRFLYHRRQTMPHPAAHDVGLQERLLDVCREASGVTLPPV